MVQMRVRNAVMCRFSNFILILVLFHAVLSCGAVREARPAGNGGIRSQLPSNDSEYGAQAVPGKADKVSRRLMVRKNASRVLGSRRQRAASYSTNESVYFDQRNPLAPIKERFKSYGSNRNKQARKLDSVQPRLENEKRNIRIDETQSIQGAKLSNSETKGSTSRPSNNNEQVGQNTDVELAHPEKHVLDDGLELAEEFTSPDQTEYLNEGFSNETRNNEVSAQGNGTERMKGQARQEIGITGQEGSYKFLDQTKDKEINQSINGYHGKAYEEEISTHESGVQDKHEEMQIQGDEGERMEMLNQETVARDGEKLVNGNIVEKGEKNNETLTDQNNDNQKQKKIAEHENFAKIVRDTEIIENNLKEDLQNNQEKNKKYQDEKVDEVSSDKEMNSDNKKSEESEFLIQENVQRDYIESSARQDKVETEESENNSENDNSQAENVPSDSPSLQDSEEEIGEDSNDLIQDFADLPSMFQDTAEKMANTLMPDIQKFSNKSITYLTHANQGIAEGFEPLVGKKFAIVLGSVLSYLFALIPLILLVLLFDHIRTYLSLHKVIQWANTYLMWYFALSTLLFVIIGLEPQTFFFKNSFSGHVYLQLLESLGYILYLVLQLVDLAMNCSKGSFVARIASFLQFSVAVFIGLHYYVTVFHRVMVHKAPRTSWKLYGLYTVAFFCLCLLSKFTAFQKEILSTNKTS